MDFHPIAELFPLIEGDEFAALVEDIRANGLREAIWTHDGKIIDGRNRYRACSVSGVEPQYREWDGQGSLTAFVVSLNIKRRHLDASQKSAVGALMVEWLAQEAAQRKRALSGTWAYDDVPANLQERQAERGEATAQAAAIVGVGSRYVAEAVALRSEPELFAEVQSGELSITDAKVLAKETPEVRTRVRQKRKSRGKSKSGSKGKSAKKLTAEVKSEMRAEVEAAATPTLVDDMGIQCADLADAQIEPGTVDVILTDPPYPREYIPVYGTLAKRAAQWLKPGGALVVMCGQSYLPEVLAQMTPHMRYYWTLAYLTPGGQSAQLWDRKVNTFWKPVLVFTRGDYAGDWIGDVARSDVNDNDKRFHGWGQSESGIADLMRRFTKPGDLVCDPMVGGGTTAVVAMAMGRQFIGFDRDPEAVETTRRRLAAVEVEADAS